MPSVKKWQAEYPAVTNQVGGDFRQQLATVDNPDDGRKQFLNSMPKVPWGRVVMEQKPHVSFKSISKTYSLYKYL